MRTIEVSEVTKLVRQLCIDANYYLPADLRVRRTSRRPSRTRPTVLPLPPRRSAAAWSRARPRRTRSRQFPPKPA